MVNETDDELRVIPMDLMSRVPGQDKKTVR